YGVPKLLLKGVSKTYASARGRTDALHQIDLSVKSGEFICIVGPSG
ncbi:MAG TPA: sulfonate ABC transporter ATP-binding protein, partial [Firmicutes bacterium]|nr:sulfonate ABC transporter ATP-binding protein [Bacillota bacterium]